MRVLASRRAGTVLTIVGSVAALVIGSFVILATLASYRTVTVERRWAKTLGTKEEILQRFPTAEANPAALELERLSAALGIDTAPRHEDGRAHPEKGKDVLPADLRGNMGTWRGTQLGRPHRVIDAPPAEVRSFVEAHEPELEAIRDLLTGGTVPRWEMRFERVEDPTIPNLLGHIQLQKLLVTDALIRMHDGDHRTAERDLDAGWTLMQAIWDHPLLIAQLIAIADAGLIFGALRQIENPSHVWSTRLSEHDFRQSFTTALKCEGWGWTQIGDTSTTVGLAGIAAKLAQSVVKPYFKLCLVDVSDAFRRRVENLDRTDALCDYDLATYEADLDIPIPRWNRLGGLVLPNLAGSIDRVARLELDLELTARLLELERIRRDTGEWPPELPGGDRSAACPKDRWIYEQNADGSISLAFGRPLEWPEGFKGHRLAVEFRVSPPG